MRFTLALLLLTTLSFAAKQPIVETDLLKIGKITEVVVTPDGAFAIYGVQTIHTDPPLPPAVDPAYSYRTNLWMCDLRDASARPVQLTFGERNDDALALSPDGRRLAFVRADEKKKPQVWLLELQSPGEPHALTSIENGATNPRWRKDGKALLVASAIPIAKLPGKPPFAEERPGRDWGDFDRAEGDKKPVATPDGDLHAIRNWLERNSEHADPADVTRINFLGELSLSGDLSFTELYRVDLDAVPHVTQLTHSFRNHGGATYSNDGSQILFSAGPDSQEHPDRLQQRSVIWSMAADGSSEHMLVHPDGYNAANAKYTFDGSHILFLASQNDQPMYRQARLAECDADGSHIKWLTADGEAAVANVEVEGDGSVYFTRNFHGGEPLYRLDLSSEKIQTTVDGPAGVNAYGVSGKTLVYASISAANPNELYLAGEPARRLTDLNASWLADKIISMPEEHWITRPDGLRVQYWVMKPTQADSGQKYPWVLDIHGGPSAMWGPGEFSMWHEFQMFCSFGYGVVYGNPRGSSGYGYSFQHANYKNWGAAPMADVMATVDDAEAKLPMIDKDRLFVTGGSYAGYLTAWIVGHTNVFKAAAALRGVYDLSTFFGEGNAFRLVPEEFGGFPWQPETRKLLDEESPITYVADIKTPLLIIHGSSDNRTGIVQGQMLFRALKELNRPVEYIRYPGAGHELTRSGAPKQRMDHMLRIIEFFERYSQNGRTAPRVETTEVHSGKSGVQ